MRFNHPRRVALNLAFATLALVGTGASAASASVAPTEPGPYVSTAPGRATNYLGVAAALAAEAGQLTTPAPTPTPTPSAAPEPTAVLPLEEGTFRQSARFGATGSWSRYHTGLDFAADTGTPVRAVVAGTVVEPSAGGWAGTHLVIRAADGSHTLYAHLSATDVAPGDTVTAGEPIGEVGETGRSFGAHLHLEYYEPGVTPGDIYSASDPAELLNANGITGW